MYPRSAWECSGGRSASLNCCLPASTTQSDLDGIPTQNVGTRDGSYAVAFSEECSLFFLMLFYGVPEPCTELLASYYVMSLLHQHLRCKNWIGGRALLRWIGRREAVLAPGAPAGGGENT